MSKKDKKIKIEFLPAKSADNVTENNVLITQLMMTAAKIGIRDLKQDNCVTIESEENYDETS